MDEWYLLLCEEAGGDGDGRRLPLLQQRLHRRSQRLANVNVQLVSKQRTDKPRRKTLNDSLFCKQETYCANTAHNQITHSLQEMTQTHGFL